MSHETLAWLTARDEGSPPALTTRVRTLVAEAGGSPGEREAPAGVLVRATGQVLARLLREHETARTSALELLAADALATYAMEALGDAPEGLEAQCTQAMRYFAELADTA